MSKLQMVLLKSGDCTLLLALCGYRSEQWYAICASREAELHHQSWRWDMARSRKGQSRDDTWIVHHKHVVRCRSTKVVGQTLQIGKAGYTPQVSHRKLWQMMPSVIPMSCEFLQSLLVTSSSILTPNVSHVRRNGECFAAAATSSVPFLSTSLDQTCTNQVQSRHRHLEEGKLRCNRSALEANMRKQWYGLCTREHSPKRSVFHNTGFLHAAAPGRSQPWSLSSLHPYFANTDLGFVISGENQRSHQMNNQSVLSA